MRFVVHTATADDVVCFIAAVYVGDLDSRTGAEILGFMRTAVEQLGQTVVMVAHDPVAAGFTNNVLFLNDGRIVDAMREPDADKVLDRLKALGG